MKWSLAACVLALACGCGPGLTTVAKAEEPAVFDLQGHRGARGLRPENTLAAFRHALEIGVSTLELDCGVTRDGVVVVSHDSALNPDITRGADGKFLEGAGAPLVTLTYEQLGPTTSAALRPGSDYAARFPGTAARGRRAHPAAQGPLRARREERQPDRALQHRDQDRSAATGADRGAEGDGRGDRRRDPRGGHGVARHDPVLRLAHARPRAHDSRRRSRPSR